MRRKGYAKRRGTPRRRSFSRRRRRNVRRGGMRTPRPGKIGYRL